MTFDGYSGSVDIIKPLKYFIFELPIVDLVSVESLSST